MNIGKILIIDDEEQNNEVLKDTLEDVNYFVKTVTNTKDAKHILNERDFDLILLDVWMPGQDGMSFLKELKQNDNLAKIIMMSGHAEHNDIVEAIKIGADDFIKKPIYDILPTIRNILSTDNTTTTHTNFNTTLKQARLTFEKDYFNFHLKQQGGNMSQIAKISGIERTTLYRKLKELGIDKK